MSKKVPSAVITDNRRARFDYAVEDTLEAGLVLTGSEVKSLRAGKAHLNDAYASFVQNELFLIGAHIAPYANAGYSGHEADRTRKLLIHKQEIAKLKMAIEAQGMTLIPLKLYWKSGKVKVALGLARGKKTIDKRETIKAREWSRNKQRILKEGL